MRLPIISSAAENGTPSVAIAGWPAASVAALAGGGAAVTLTVPASAGRSTRRLVARWPSGDTFTLPLTTGPDVTLVERLGEPDDVVIAPDGSVLFSNLRTNTVDQLVSGGQVRTLVSGLRVPEGVAVAGPDTLIVAEQGTNRVLRWTAGRGVQSLLQLPVRSGVEGIDGLTLGTINGKQTVLVPDSAGGRLLLLPLDGAQATAVPGRWQRPTDAVLWHGEVFLVDENGGRLWRGPVAGPLEPVGPRLSLPDDVVVDANGVAYVNELGAGGRIQAIQPSGQATVVLSGMSDPQGLALDGAGNLVIAESGVGRISAYVRTCLPLLMGSPTVKLAVGGPAVRVAFGSDCAGGAEAPQFTLAVGAPWPTAHGPTTADSSSVTLVRGITATLVGGLPAGTAIVEIHPPTTGPTTPITTALEVQLKIGGGTVPVQVGIKLTG